MNKRGFALIAVLTLAIIVGIGIAAILQMMTSSASMTQMSKADIQAQYLAEAGMQRAVYECRNGNCTNGTVSFSEDGQTITVTKTVSGGNVTIDATVAVT